MLAGKEWEADEAAERLIDEGRIEPLIIVAMDSGGRASGDEYLPTRWRDAGRPGDRYARMLVEELKPWVDETFRTRPGREDTGIAGSSLGGIASLWIGLTHPEVFGKIAALSTSAKRDDGEILRFVAALPDKPEAVVWTDMGTDEGPGHVEGARRLRDALVAKGWEEGGTSPTSRPRASPTTRWRGRSAFRQFWSSCFHREPTRRQPTRSMAEKIR